jgi:hypothetical protein
VVDVVEELLDVDLHNVSVAATPDQADHFQRVGTAFLRPEPIRALLEVGLEKRLDDNLHCRLHHPIAHRRYPQRSLRSVRLRDVLAPYRLRPVPARSETLLYL